MNIARTKCEICVLRSILIETPVTPVISCLEDFEMRANMDQNDYILLSLKDDNDINCISNEAMLSIKFESNNNNGNSNNIQIHLNELPKPTFRLIPECDRKRRTYTATTQKSKITYTKDSYYHYDEPTPEDLMDRVEYDMDKQDEEWLRMFNQTGAPAQHGYVVSEDDFEKIMDRLEKESYFESKKSGKEIAPEVDEDAVCAICEDGESHDANAILFCDMCELAVHQECYGVPYIPEGQWLCRRCLQSPSCNVSCVFCPNKGGAFKQTDDGRWAHVICALWIPEVCFANTVFLEPIDSIDNIPAARWRLTCYICKQKKNGACIQCHKPNCYVPFHVTCAQQAGLYMKMRNYRFSNFDDMKREAFCDSHGPPNGRYDRAMYIVDESEHEVDNRSLRCKKRRKHRKRDNMKKTRKILAEKRLIAFNPIAEPSVREEKLIEISKLLNLNRDSKKSEETDLAILEIIGYIKGYWLTKRQKRNGVPLLRRLQVSYNNSISKGSYNDGNSKLDEERYTKLRYDLEKARLLVGEVKKREALKKKMFRMSREIVDMKFKAIDNERPLPEEKPPQ